MVNACLATKNQFSHENNQRVTQLEQLVDESLFYYQDETLEIEQICLDPSPKMKGKL